MITNIKKLKVAMVQQANSNNQDLNRSNALDAIYEASQKGAELILLSELHHLLYLAQNEDIHRFDWAETLSGPTIEALRDIASKLSVVIVAPIFEEEAKGLYYNTAVVIEKNGEIAGKYRKMHIPEEPQYHEKYYFAPGNLGFNPIQTSVGKLGILICWDQWFPEAARLMALRGADILLYPTAIGWKTSEKDPVVRSREREAWTIIQRSHAIANGLPLMACNRVGFESKILKETVQKKTTEKETEHSEGILFWGSSFIAGSQGEIVVQASSDQPAVITAELKLDASIRHAWPFFRDRRIDSYQGLLNSWGSDP